MDSFYEFTININKLNKLYLDKINLELNKQKIKGITPIEALLLSNIGEEPTYVTNAPNKRYYVGTNIAYNVKKLVKNGYIDRLVDHDDKRCAFLVLTKKGKDVLKILNSVNVSQWNLLKNMKIDVNNINEILVKLQRIF